MLHNVNPSPPGTEWREGKSGTLNQSRVQHTTRVDHGPSSSVRFYARETVGTASLALLSGVRLSLWKKSTSLRSSRHAILDLVARLFAFFFEAVSS